MKCDRCGTVLPLKGQTRCADCLDLSAKKTAACTKCNGRGGYTCPSCEGAGCFDCAMVDGWFRCICTLD